MSPVVILLAMVTIERLAELWLAHRNIRSENVALGELRRVGTSRL